MGQNTPARAATAGEIVKFRQENQYSELGLAVQPIEVIYTCRINQTFTTLNGVLELTVDGAVGTITDVKPGMMAFIGSTAGARDKGIVRIRKDITATKVYIGETSNIQFADDDYVSIVNSFSIWPRDLRLDGGIPKMDGDILFSTGLQFPPLPALGPPVAIIRTDTFPVTFTPPDPSDYTSSPLSVATLSYLYECPTAASVTGETTTQPIMTFDASGWHRYSCTITEEEGRVSVGYRWVAINPTEIPFELESCSGDFSSGNWSFEVQCHESVADLYERALCVLYAKNDFYNSTKGSVGKIEGYENIIAIGWIAERGIEYSAELGLVSLRVEGAGYWLEQIRSFPSGLTDTDTAATSWVEVEELTVDKALAHLLTHCTTAPLVMDCVLSGDTKRIRTLAAPKSNLWEQMQTIAFSTIFAKPMVNNLCQLFVQIDSQLLSTADRSSVPVVVSLDKQDWAGGVRFSPRDVENISMLQLQGISPYDGVEDTTALFSRAPGDNGNIYGDDTVQDAYVFADQADCNRIAGCLLAIANNPYSIIDITLPANNRLIDICPLQYVRFTVDPDQNPLDISLANVRAVPRKVVYRYDKEAGALLVSLSLEVEAIGVDGIAYTPPSAPVDNLPPVEGPPGIGDFPGLDDWFPPWMPPVTDYGDCNSLVGNGPFPLNWDKSFITGSDADPTARCYISCVIHSAAQIHTFVRLGVYAYHGDAYDNVAITATLGGADVLSIAKPTGNFEQELAPPSEVEIDGFKIALTPGDDATLQPGMLQAGYAFIVGGAVDSGLVNSRSETGTWFENMIIGNWYRLMVEAPSVAARPVFQVNMGAGFGGEGPGTAGAMGIYDNAPTVLDNRPYWIPASAYWVTTGNNYACFFQARFTGFFVRQWYWDTPEFQAGNHTVVIRNATFTNPRSISLVAGSIRNICAL